MENKHQSYDLPQMQSLPLSTKIRMTERSDGEMADKKEYVLVTDGIIEMTCKADSYKEATNLFLDYLKNKNDDCIYKFQQPGEIYEYNGNKLKTVHFIFNKHYIDILRSRE